MVEFDYTVKDVHNSEITNHVRLETVGALPDRGIHDDTSFNFKYGTLDPDPATGSWEAITSKTNINHTLHRTRKLNDTATFDFVGSGFTAYLQGVLGGAKWELRLDGDTTPLDWEVQPDGSATVSRDGVTCFTRASIVDGLISNYTRNAYTVTCSGLEGGVSHKVDMINRENYRYLEIDAFFIKFPGDPLLPGIHDVDEPDVFTAFPGWDLFSYYYASNGMGLKTSSALVSDPVFYFSGSGISIETTLEGVYQGGGVYEGVNYDICITPQVDLVYGDEVCQNFNNGLGGTSYPAYNVFRSFFGYNYNPVDPTPDAHRVRIHINSMPAGGRLVVDSIRVYDDKPTGPITLTQRVAEDDEVGPFVVENGKRDSWYLNTRYSTRASNSSLTYLNYGVKAAGPFIAFEVPADADLIHYYRYPGYRDSQHLMVCVDRGQGESGFEQPCKEYNLRTSPNPLVIRESDFSDGWGDGWMDENIHTVEIFSLTNETFNLDKIEVFDSTQPFSEGYYEDYMLNANNNAYGFFDASETLNGGSYQFLSGYAAGYYSSGQTTAQSNVVDEGALFQMYGTGFTTYFTEDRYAGLAQVCWAQGQLDTVQAVEDADNCVTYNNRSLYTYYQVGRSILGLPENYYTVVVRNLDEPTYNTHLMKFDAIQVYDTPVPTNVLTGDGTRYETSYTNQADEGNFAYYGDGWTSYSGIYARYYSGSNYDRILRKPGAGLVFQIQGVDTLQIIRPARYGYADMQLCVDDGGDCTDIPATNDPAVVHLVDLVSGFNKNATHVISLSLTSSGYFYLDAIDLYDSSTPIPPGMYEGDYVSLKYSGTWIKRPSSLYTERYGQYTTEDGAQLLFSMTGSHFQIGAFAKLYDQMEICYVPGIELDADNVDQNCVDFPANSGQSLYYRQVYTSPQLGATAGDFTVRVRNSNPGSLYYRPLVIDYVQILDGLNPLTEGRHEDEHIILQDARHGTWTNESSYYATNRSYLQTAEEGDYLDFKITGTGVGIGTFMNLFGSEMRLCYKPDSAGFDGTWDGNDGEHCLEFQNEASHANTNITRSIAGLPYDTYRIGVVNLDDGFSNRYSTPIVRDVGRYPPTLVVDFVEVYGALPPRMISTDAGSYNEDAVDENGRPWIQTLPEDRWTTMTGAYARTATYGSYAGVSGTSTRPVYNYAGQSVVAYLKLPANSTSYFILDTYQAYSANSDQLRYCIIDGIDMDCTTVDTMKTQRYQIIPLVNSGGGKNITLSITTDSPGYFRVDGFQWISGGTIGAGVYEDLLFNTIDAFTTSGTGWEQATNYGATERSRFQTTESGDYIQFTMHGTGLSVGTAIGLTGTEMRICYVQANNFDGNWDGSGTEHCLDYQNENQSTSNTVSRTIAGLPEDNYRVAVISLDDGTSEIYGTRRYPAVGVVDYIEVLNTPAPALLQLSDAGEYNESAVNGSGDALSATAPGRTLGTAHRLLRTWGI